MSYRIFQPFFRTKTSEEYVGYPIYRTHLSLDRDRNVNKPQEMNVLQNGAYYRVHNVNGSFKDSSYGRSTGSSYAVYRSHMSNFDGCNPSKNNDLLNFNEKKTMQSLNDRLASYLENVKSLEKENELLEEKICDWYTENEGLVFPDCSQYFNDIMDLQNQVRSVSAHNAKITQEIEDSQRTADGYAQKYEIELITKTKAEEELCNDYELLENIHEESQKLDLYIEHLEQELLQVKKRSQEEITFLQAQLGTRVAVEVEAAPSIDLNAALSDIRNEYETLMERNFDDVEKMFHEMTSELSYEVSSGIEELQLSSNEIMELKLYVHTLETELRKQRSMVTAHECALTEISEHYDSYLSYLQGMINMNESHLEDIKSKLKQLHIEYNVSMDLKTSLEKEIDAYNHLLEKHKNMNSPWKKTYETGEFWYDSDEDTSEQTSTE
ncbi:keratin, type I cytoskeletal 19-like [Leptodactylus fuscus]|uniref:keratin, type I cytoskeletal 19-like n=1 Tax=Leptodactylus fuscus TaxID=238119 RepID=UPI003F4E803F